MTVTVMGEALMDVVIGEGGAELSPGGSPANVALGLGRLGIGATLHTSLADDEFGTLISSHLEASGASITETSWSADRTSSAVATIGGDGGAIYSFDVLWNPAPAPAIYSDLFHAGSISSVLEPGASLVLAAMQAAKTRGSITTFDPNIRPSLTNDPQRARDRIFELVNLSDVVKLSDEDAAWLYPGMRFDEAISSLLRRGPSVVALTRGSKGSVLTSGSQRIECPPSPTTVVDTIGAGDTFMAALIAKVLENPVRRGVPAPTSWMQDAAVSASRAAAITVSRKGADLPWAAELNRASDHR